MDKHEMKGILEKVASGELSVDDAIMQIKMAPFEDIDIAKPDHHRGIRQGTPEIIYGEGKTASQINLIAENLLKAGQSTILITRLSEEKASELSKELPFTYFPEGRIGLVGEKKPPVGDGRVVIVTGGTSDIPVAEEAALTAEILGTNVERLYDVGVSGLHRLLSNVEMVMRARVVIAVAGMEGALASVVGGLVDCPVIAVPTSIGYGASFGGVAALLSMINSCASGVSVVNIDNGFGAGYLANQINHMVEEGR